MTKSTLLLFVLSFCLAIISARYPSLSTFCKMTPKHSHYSFNRVRTQICYSDVEYSWCGILDKAMPIMCTFYNEPTTAVLKRSYLDTEDVRIDMQNLPEESNNYNKLLDEQEFNVDLFNMQGKRDQFKPDTILYECCKFNCSAKYIMEFYCRN